MNIENISQMKLAIVGLGYVGVHLHAGEVLGDGAHARDVAAVVRHVQRAHGDERPHLAIARQ